MATNPVTQEPTGARRMAADGASFERERSALLEIEDAVTASSGSPHEAVARILATRATDAGLLQGLPYAGSRDGYTRQLIYAGVDFSVLALIWLPGQMSPIHGHRSWCVLGIHRGTLVESCFTREQAGSRLTLETCRQLRPGMVSHSDGDEAQYHRVANLGVETAVSIHVYGVAFERLGHGLNRIWDDAP